jgi:hypothetical protein
MKRLCTMFGSVLVVALIATFAITTESTKAVPHQGQLTQSEINDLRAMSPSEWTAWVATQDVPDDDLVMAIDCTLPKYQPLNIGCSYFDLCREFGNPSTCEHCVGWAGTKCLAYQIICGWTQQQVVDCFQGVLDCECFDPLCFC